ncbi:hypothetical protein HHL23_13225 [Chryseobacterium sp. RP-3-3]|uniref:Lipoprotein n=1 Tax=Chryseobacterium antibioticum TaxID=2728847 RepID=A0A7Y0ANT6_9FLAO|nr:hypothetical protein [Chryseobacterium antibioticum]NML70748.1 hypothetical protein [Chryseobacterium antibioticum]
MKKIISQIFTIALFFTVFSCTNYIKPIHTESVSGSENITRKLIFQDGALDVNFYGDYIFDKVDKNFIFFTDKDISGILGNLKEKPSSQILFTYTKSSIYNNMLAFYYAEKTLADVKKNFFIQTSKKEMQNGLLYVYEYKGYYVMEFYRQEEKGIVRFISINNSAKQSVDKCRLENNNVFFDINPQLWNEL